MNNNKIGLEIDPQMRRRRKTIFLKYTSLFSNTRQIECTNVSLICGCISQPIPLQFINTQTLYHTSRLLANGYHCYRRF